MIAFALMCVFGVQAKGLKGKTIAPIGARHLGNVVRPQSFWECKDGREN